MYEHVKLVRVIVRKFVLQDIASEFDAHWVLCYIDPVPD